MEHDKLWRRPPTKQTSKWQPKPEQSAQFIPSTTSPVQSDPSDRPSRSTESQHITQKHTPKQKDPRKLAKYFDDTKGPMCFQCTKDCPERNVYKIKTASDDAFTSMESWQDSPFAYKLTMAQLLLLCGVD